MPLPTTMATNIRASSTPSPQPVDLLNTLLQIKDTINSKLLEETKQSVDLANIHTAVEEHLREVVEQTIRTVKVEFDRRKRKTVPNIRRLEETLKSLIKAEKQLRESERFSKKFAVKKVQRRIRNAQRTLQEYILPEAEPNLYKVLTDHISVLCFRLQQLPAKLTATDNTTREEPIPRDSDSDDSIESPRKDLVTLDEKYTLPNIIKSERDDGIAAARCFAGVNHEPENAFAFQTEHVQDEATLAGNRLNGVHLFSSDSDSFDGKEEEDNFRPIIEDSMYAHGLETSNGNLDDIEMVDGLDAQDKTDLADIHDHAGMKDLSANDTKRKSRDRNRRKYSPYGDSKNVFENTETPQNVFRESEVLVNKLHVINDPQYEYEWDESQVKRPEKDEPMSDTKISSKQVTPAARSQKSAHKRMLPSLPLHILDDRPDNTHINQNKHERQHLQTTPSVSKTNTTNTSGVHLDKAVETIDIEEIKFKESVRTARRHILEKLKSKCTMQQSNFAKKHDTNVNTYQLSSSASHPVSGASSSSLRKYNSTSALDKHAKSPVEDTAVPKSPLLDIRSQIDDVVYQHNNANSAYDAHQEQVNSNLAIRHGIKLQMDENTPREISTPECVSKLSDTNVEADSTNRAISPCVYKGKLIHIVDATAINGNVVEQETCVAEARVSEYSEMTSNTEQSHSIVGQGIKNFENRITHESNSLDITETNVNSQFKGRGMLKGQMYVRHRTASEGRTQSRGVHYNQSNRANSEYVDFKFSNNALKPRVNNNGNHLTNHDADATENPVLLDTYPFRRQNTESELDKLCKTDSALSIREGWRQRRSSSLTPKVPERTYKIGPTFDYKASFKLRDYGTQCQASGILQLPEGFIVVLDRRNSCLQLFNIDYEPLHTCTISDNSGGIVEICDSKFAVSYLYRSKLGVYRIAGGMIKLDKELEIPCTEWITDIGFACNHIHVLCKAGDIHIIKVNGVEEKVISTGSNGKLLVHPSGKRFYILAEGRVIRFDSKGNMISSRGDIDAHSVILLKDRLYAADRRKHMIVPVTDFPDVNNLTSEPVEFPFSVSVSKKGNVLLVSQFEENMPVSKTRTIKVFKLKR